MRNEIDFFVSVEDNAVLLLVFLDLGWPVLVTFHFGILLGVSQHYNQRHLLLVDHAPEVFNRGLQGPLGGDEQLVVTCQRGVDVVGVYVRVVSVFVSLREPYL